MKQEGTVGEYLKHKSYEKPDYVPLSIDEVLKKTFPSAGKFSRAQANARIAQLRAEGKGNKEIFTIMQQEGFNP